MKINGKRYKWNKIVWKHRWEFMQEMFGGLILIGTMTILYILITNLK